MSKVGFQDFWVAGSRFYYQRDAIAGVAQPFIDLGVITPVNPSLDVQSVQLQDSDGGRNSLVDEALISYTEAYEIECSNMNLDNLALLFLSNPPTAFTQVAEDLNISQYVTLDRLTKLVDATGELLYGLSSIAGAYTGTMDTMAITTFDVATQTITTSDDHSTLSPGDPFIVGGDGLANIANAGTYEVLSATGVGPTAIVVAATTPLAADETAVTVVGLEENAGTIVPFSEFSVISASRGLCRVDTGVIAADALLTIVSTTTALSGLRSISPQELTGNVQGKGILVWGRDNNADQSFRDFRCSLTPSSANIQASDFSTWTLRVQVIEEVGAANPFGRMTQGVGDLPTDIS